MYSQKTYHKGSHSLAFSSQSNSKASSGALVLLWVNSHHISQPTRHRKRNTSSTRCNKLVWKGRKKSLSQMRRNHHLYNNQPSQLQVHQSRFIHQRLLRRSCRMRRLMRLSTWSRSRISRWLKRRRFSYSKIWKSMDSSPSFSVHPSPTPSSILQA